MMQKINYQKELEKIINSLDGATSLLLHSCCAPCSSYVIEYLSHYFRITVFYYNPNIYPESEYEHRKTEQKRLIAEMPTEYPVNFLDCDFDSERFYKAVRGLENCREGGERCRKCFDLRLSEAAEKAKKGGFDFFTTTLTISPLKNASLINELGKANAQKYGVEFLPSDFKKKNGYKRSIELSREYSLYRQSYCGCIFSQRDANNG